MGRSRVALACLGLPWLAGVAAAATWSLQASVAGWRLGLAWWTVAACGLLAAGWWLRAPRGTLTWEGGGWHWEEEGSPAGGAAQAGQPEVALDLQSRLLLRWRPEQGGVRWLWLERDTAAARWDALRRAVYSRASTDAAHGAQTPVA